MDVYIHKDALGLSQHLVCHSQTKKIGKVKDLPETPLVYGTRQFSELAELYSIELPQFPPPAHRKALLTALGNQDVAKVPWALVMPPAAFMSAVQELAHFLLERFSSLDLSYYQTHYKATHDILDLMQPAKIDPVAWKVLGDSHDATQIVKSFEPDSLGFAQEIIYSRATRTGRMKVVSGPKILTLPEDQRSLVTSRFGKNGKVVALDYSSLEPRVALLLGSNSSNTIPPFPPSYGNPPLVPLPTGEDDIYTHISKKLNLSEIPRATMKEIVLSQLYGARRETIASRLGSIRDVDGLIELVDDFFGLQKMRSLLREENERSGRTHILSRYGRWVDTVGAEDYVLLNYYIQSTAVDVALYGFKNMLEFLGARTDIVPLFLIHDSIVLDVKATAETQIDALCEVGSTNIPLFPGVRFPLKASRF